MPPESTPPPGQALHAGTRLEEFETESVLGRGGFGITYLARDISLERQVVIKENLPTMCAYREATSGTVRPQSEVGEDVDTYRWSMENFLREATTLASLDHSGIVPVLRKFEANGTAYFVMPYMEGLPLDELMKNRRERGEEISDDELRGLLEHVLDALGYLHARGIYHRDIKPGNILVTKEGVPILIDFGSARQQMSERSMTVVESAGYTPFEQLQSRGNVGPWSDLYSLGATVAKAITGEAPPKAADRVYDDPWVPLSKRTDLRERYSGVLLGSIDRALESQASLRFQDAGEWLGALQGEPSGYGEEASVPPVPESADNRGPLPRWHEGASVPPVPESAPKALPPLAQLVPEEVPSPPPAAQGLTLAGMNLGYACPIVAIVATVVGCANLATMRILDFPSFNWSSDGPLIGYFLYMMAVFVIPFSLAAGLPLLANLRKKARVFCIIGLLGALISFVLIALNFLMFSVLSRWDQDSFWWDHWWFSNDSSLWSARASHLADAVLIVCLSVTCLSFEKKVLGFVALPFAVLFLVISIPSFFSRDEIPWFWYAFFAIVVILGSIATMLDEKNRLRRARSEDSQHG